MTHSALRLVENSFSESSFQVGSDDFPVDCHSLHSSFGLPGLMRSEIPAYFIDRYSKKGEIVLDPFCGVGAVALNANLLGRPCISADVNKFLVFAARAKAEPIDITELTLRLQQINLKRPVTLTHFNQAFCYHYDLNTFRELVNLRAFLHQNPDRASRYIELIVLSLLHGHTGGYFSGYSLPQIALSPEEQRSLNLKRGLVPDYRAIVPRILRKAASVLRDSLPSILKQSELKNRYLVSDPRALDAVNSASVDLVVSLVPGMQPDNFASQQWLRLWFAEYEVEANPDLDGSLEAWRAYMNSSLLELARVVKHGKRVVLCSSCVGQQPSLDDELMRMVEECFSQYFETETLYSEKLAGVQVGEVVKNRSQLSPYKILVLRRR